MSFRTELFVLSFLTALCVVTGSPYVVTYEEFEDNTVNPQEINNRHLLGKKSCTQGPAYWCYNITQAKQCGAVSHCITKVWEPMKLPTDNDSVCEVCKEMVKEARDQLNSNETQDELRQVLEGSCNLIPLKIISSECCKLADDFIPELVDALSSRMDPQVVCAVSGLCNSVRIDEMLGEMKEIDTERVPEPFDLKKDSCPKCNHFMGKAVAFLRRMTKEDLLNKMLQVCGHVGSYSDSCRGIVMQEIDVIYNHVQNQMNSAEMCGLMGLCEVVSIHPVRIQSSVSSVRVWTPPGNDVDLECDFCKQLIVYLKNWFTADTTKEEFHDLIIGMCKQTGKYRQECINLATEYGKEIYDMLLQDLNPEEVCSSVGLCENSTIRGRVKLFSSAANAGPIWTLLPIDSDKAIPLTKLQTAERMTGEDEKKSHQPGFVYPMMKLGAPELITGNDEANAHKLGGVRDILPTCALCSFTITKLIDLIGRNRSKAAIDKAMDEVCYLIPESYEAKCLTFMKEYGERVAEMILIEGTAHEICATLHLCLLSPEPAIETQPSKKLVGEAMLPFDRYMPQVMVNVQDQKVSEKPTCALCEFVMTRLDSMLENNSTEEQIKDTVEQICKYMPRTVRDECRQFIDEYGDLVINYLAQELEPREICQKINLCDQSVQQDDEDDTPVMDLQMDKCEMCMIISDYLSAFLDDPKFDTSIEKLAEKICPLLPAKHRTECKDLIEDYGPYLLSLLAQATDKGKACQQVNLCPKRA